MCFRKTRICIVHVVAGSATGTFTMNGAAGVDDTFGASSATDTITGNTGSDTVDYSDSTLAVSINLNDSGNASGAPVTFSNPADGTIGGGDATGDTLNGIENLRGGSGNDFLFGNSSANRLYGGAGNDTLRGEGGNDILVGGPGNDTLDGGLGFDRMVFNETGLSNQDIINNYIGSGADRDTLDVSSLLDATFNNALNVNNFVHISVSGANALVQVDATGAGNFTTAGNVATITNYGTIGNVVSVYFEGAEHQVHVA